MDFRTWVFSGFRVFPVFPRRFFWFSMFYFHVSPVSRVSRFKWKHNIRKKCFAGFASQPLLSGFFYSSPFRKVCAEIHSLVEFISGEQWKKAWNVCFGFWNDDAGAGRLRMPEPDACGHRTERDGTRTTGPPPDTRTREHLRFRMVRMAYYRLDVFTCQ